jgi:hypothetical protein
MAEPRSKETGLYRQSRHLGASSRVDPQWGPGKHIHRAGRAVYVAGRAIVIGE